MCKSFNDVHELEKLIYQSLIESAGSKFQIAKLERIEWPDGKSPYPGLSSFDQEYAELYFGRDREVNQVIGKMSEAGGRFVIISGASGPGKSSLVGAGLWRELIREGRLPGSRTWEWQRIQPSEGKTPFESLAKGLREKRSLSIAQRPEKLADELARKSGMLGEILALKLTGDRELLLFIDQLEELFTQSFKDEDIKSFLAQLVDTACDKTKRLRVVTTVRTEFLARLEEVEPVLQLINAGYIHHLGPVSPRALQDMIEEPARVTGYEFNSISRGYLA